VWSRNLENEETKVLYGVVKNTTKRVVTPRKQTILFLSSTVLYRYFNDWALYVELCYILYFWLFPHPWFYLYMDIWKIKGWIKEWMNELTNEWMNERMNEWMNEWMNERMNEQLNEWMNEWTNEWMNKWMNEWMNEGMNEWMNEWRNEWMNEWRNEWMKEWMNGRINEWMNERMNEWMNVAAQWKDRLWSPHRLLSASLPSSVKRPERKADPPLHTVPMLRMTGSTPPPPNTPARRARDKHYSWYAVCNAALSTRIPTAI